MATASARQLPQPKAPQTKSSLQEYIAVLRGLLLKDSRQVHGLVSGWPHCANFRKLQTHNLPAKGDKFTLGWIADKWIRLSNACQCELASLHATATKWSVVGLSRLDASWCKTEWSCDQVLCWGRSFCLGLHDRDMVAAEEVIPRLSAPWARAQKGSGGLALAMRHCGKRVGNSSPAAPMSLWGTVLKLTRFHSTSGHQSISDLQGMHQSTVSCEQDRRAAWRACVWYWGGCCSAWGLGNLQQGP